MRQPPSWERARACPVLDTGVRVLNPPPTHTNPSVIPVKAGIQRCQQTWQVPFL